VTIPDDPRLLSNDQLAECIRVAASEQTAHQAWWFSLIAEFDRRDGHLEFGMHSCSQFLSWWCGIEIRTAREQVRVIRKLQDLPLVRAAFEAGRLTYSKVRALTRSATTKNESQLLSLAADLTATQLERVVGALESAQQVLTQDDDDRRRTQCGVMRWVDELGLVHHEVVSAPDQAGLVDAALGFGRDNLFQEAKAAAKEAKAATNGEGPAEEEEVPMPRPTPARRRLDALLWVLQRGMVNANRTDLVDESRYLVMLHVREGEAMVTDDGKVDLGNGLAVTPRTLRRLGCGGLVQGMLHGVDGQPLDLGDRVRLTTRNQRLALEAMYPTCEIPGCDVPFAWCEVHHLVPWENGGPTDMDNLRPRCSFHHHLVHEGGWREVLGVDGRTVLIRPDGTRQIGPSPSMVAVPVSPVALVYGNRERGVVPLSSAELASLGGHAMGERLTRWGMAMIIDALLALDAPSDGGAGAGRDELADLDAAATVDDLVGSGAGRTSPPSG
jgi:hypothetical protein